MGLLSLLLSIVGLGCLLGGITWALLRPSPARVTIELYRDVSRLHRWRAREDNGHILADSGEGYRNEADRDKIVARLFPLAKVKEL